MSYADLSGYGGVGRCTGRHAGQYRISGKLNSFSSSLLSINSLHAYKFLYWKGLYPLTFLFMFLSSRINGVG